MGSIVGLVTGLFVFFDRVVRARPRLWVEAERVGQNAYPVIRIHNLDTAPLFVRGVASSSSRYTIAGDTSVSGIVRAMTGNRLDALIGGQSEMAFQIIDNKSSDSEHLDDGRVRFTVRWRRASSPEVWQLPVSVLVRPSRIKEMVEGVKRARQDRYS